MKYIPFSNFHGGYFPDNNSTEHTQQVSVVSLIKSRASSFPDLLERENTKDWKGRAFLKRNFYSLGTSSNPTPFSKVDSRTNPFS